MSNSKRDLLLDLKRRELTAPPQMAVGDGTLGFGKDMWGGVRPCPPAALLGEQKGQRPQQALPKAIQRQAKLRLQQI